MSWHAFLGHGGEGVWMWLAWVGKPYVGLRCGNFGEGDGEYLLWRPTRYWD